MALSGLFLDASTSHDLFVHGRHHPGLVLLSLFVSIFSATMALQTAQIARKTQTPLYRMIAIVTGAVALGGAVWTTHFIGMLAFELPATVNYSTALTLFSIVPACAASWFALRMLAMPTISRAQLLQSGILVGLGIGAMHYTGMAAMRTSLEMFYEPVTFGLSIVVAVLLAVSGLWLRFGLQRTDLSPAARTVTAGSVLGLAIAGMHYTGMAAVRFVGEPGESASGLLLDATYTSLALSSFTITVAVLVVAVNGLIQSQELNRRMEEGHSRLQATLETAVDGIITIDCRGLIQDFNKSAERLFGWKAEEVIGRNIKMLMPEPYQSAHDGYLENYMTSGQPKIIGIGREVTGLRKDGSHMPMRLAVGRVELPGQLLFVGFVSDISDRIALEASLREAAERAEQAAAAKSTFLANMSHEIRTPMNSIIGFTELLLQTDLAPTQRAHLDTIRQASRSLLRLLNDILDTTKMEKGRLELECTDFSLKALAMQIESSMRLAATEKGLQLLTRYPDDMPVHFRGDPLRVLQILTNLVGNAIKFTAQGSVEVVFAYDAAGVHLQVRDTGIGMTQQEIDSIFSPFTQADASISRRFGGTGLGTTIARQLVELMGGKIDVESTPGLGSTFHVHLPLPEGKAPEAEGDRRDICALPPLNILIADDVAQNLQLLALTLERQGHHVTHANDGSEALAQYVKAQGAFDVVLMDVHMPGVDGLQATRLIRQHERTQGIPTTPVIALTASVMEADREAARRAGMDGFALKPLDPPALFNEIARVTEGQSRAAVPARRPTTDAVPNVDWDAGVTLWGNREQLATALSAFLAKVEQQYPLPQALAGDSDRETLRFSAHGLRGAAGNLALPIVARLAGEIEDQLRAGRSESVLPKVQALQRALLDVRQALDAHVAGQATVPAAPGGPGDAGVDIVHAIGTLLRYTRGNELNDHALDVVCQALEGEGAHADARRLRSAFNAFEFEDAAELLEHLLAQRGCTTLI